MQPLTEEISGAEAKDIMAQVRAKVLADPKLKALHDTAAEAARPKIPKFGEREIRDNRRILTAMIDLDKQSEATEALPASQETRDEMARLRVAKETLSAQLFRDVRGIPVSEYMRRNTQYVPGSARLICPTCLFSRATTPEETFEHLNSFSKPQCLGTRAARHVATDIEIEF